MTTNSYRLMNAKFLSEEISKGMLIIRGGMISEINSINDDYLECNTQSDMKSIDLKGHYLFPGFIDIHCHGGCGSSFMDCTYEDFERVLSYHHRNGVTTIFPTTVSCDNKLLVSFLETYQNYANEKKPNYTMLGGVHLEGPYLSAEKAGAQTKVFCVPPDFSFVRNIINKYPFIKRWTIAPERDTDYVLSHYLSENHILVSAGHTNVLYEEMCRAIKNNYKHMTHLYSGMNGMTYIDGLRNAGAVEAALLSSDVSVEIIADGIHLPYPIIELVYKMKGADKIAIVTDAMRGAGMSGKKSMLGNRLSGTPVILEGGVAKLPDHSSLAGSITTLFKMFRGLVHNTSIPFIDIVKMCSSSPAKIMNIHNLFGTIEEGKVANLIELDENLNLVAVIQNGIYEKVL